jgi:hypothetical protein
MPGKYLGDGLHPSFKVDDLLDVLLSDRNWYSFNIDLDTIPQREEFKERPVIMVGYKRTDFLAELEKFVKQIGLYCGDSKVKSCTKLNLTTLTVEVFCTSAEYDKIAIKFAENII